MKIQKIMSTNISRKARNATIGSMVALSTLAGGATLQAKNTITKPKIEQNNNVTKSKQDKLKELALIFGSVFGGLAFFAATPDSEIGKKHWGYHWYFDSDKSKKI